jgi:hypothetical protein
MKSVLSKENVVPTLHKVMQYVIIAAALVVGYFVGKYTHKIEVNNNMSKNIYRDNPYRSMRSTKEISIAVDEHNELLLINKKTGKYQVYSDSVGMCIFKMYSYRIYQNATQP